ncbi:MAG: FUSC family protein [Alphaproteobacteria bacterium]|nr:FUSC family protein [Alphaproteobacteria bacterium]MBV8413225.1 FUSC family protein [Alphaproteobacteria bacterium]
MTEGPMVSAGGQAAISARHPLQDPLPTAREVRPTPGISASASASPSPRLRAAIFAAKTTVAALLALWVAFRFNLDDPKWALLTVFIVARPESGQVLAKSFYRIIGTLVGAAIAVLLVSLFAQERVLFLGSMAVWIAVCTFASRHFRNFTSYACVLSGYTAAIVGIPAALSPESAFYIAQARITEIMLGILATAAISHLVLPDRLTVSLRAAIASSRAAVVDGALALLEQRDAPALLNGMATQVIAIENLRSSAIFEDRAVRLCSEAIRRLGAAILAVVDAARRLDRDPWGHRLCLAALPDLQPAARKAAAAIELWRDGKLDARALGYAFARASAELPLGRDVCQDPLGNANDAVRGAAAIGSLRNFLAAFDAFAGAHEALLSSEPPATTPVPFAVSNDFVAAAWAGVRAALALVVASTFWILADWPDGATAVVLATLVTARFATMDGAAAAAAKAVALFVLITVPSFVVVEVLLADSSGYPMFCLVVAPLLFLNAWSMAKPKLAGMGFAAALYFASVAGLQDRMAYDPVAFINTSLAAIFAVALSAVLFAIVAPDTPEAARRGFERAMRRQFARIAQAPHIGNVQFATATVEALDQLCRVLPADQTERAIDTGLALLGAGSELIRVRDQAPTQKADAAAGRIAAALAQEGRPALDGAVRLARQASLECLAELREEHLNVGAARTRQRDMYAFAAASLAFERTRGLLENRKPKGEPVHVA